ncbi:hypothetical protein SAMN04489760_12935 [Syntrophus gentianae]|uniref:Uncharacterized protein n=1 Tax=Syntrophus gentianae TaxID=43775 RepID=A0A1H8A0E3_9BACT|nr:hypothetical protein [Syntrophus gentianae]SEM64392.1 hypothetical protein SAMN04489760_12935 [Syntrophus gentianae]
MRTRILFYFVILLLSVGLAGVAGSQSLTPKEQLGKLIFNDMNLSLTEV